MEAVPEQIGFGDRRLKEDYDSDPELKDNPAANSCYQISSRLLLSGESILKYRLWDIISALRVLEKRDDVLKDQIKIVGFSGGAPAAVLASLFEDRIDEVAISGYTSYYKDSIMARRHCLDNYLPGILKLAELPTIISAIAPRPLLIQAAEADHLFPPESAVLAYQEIKRVYRFLNAEAEIEFNLIQGEHSAEAEPIIKFFDQIY
ncbi:MAG: alpha/beta hydrolase family protein [Halanaerobium sp.]